MKRSCEKTLSPMVCRNAMFIFVFLYIWSLNGIAQDIWQSSEGPFGGSVYAITSTPNGTVYAGTQYGGVLKSVNNGITWQPTSLGGSMFSLLAISDSIIFAGGYSSYVYRTTDAGETWVLRNEGLPSSSVESIVSNSKGYLFAATRDGVYRSEDNGDTWIAVNTNLTDLDVNVLQTTSDDVLFAGTQNSGVFRSANDGQSWTQLTNNIPVASILALCVDNADSIFAGVGSNNGVYISADKGDTWRYLGLNNRIVRSLALNSDREIFVGTWQSGIYYSTDGGGTWLSANLLYSPLNIQTIYIDPLTDDIYAGSLWYYGAGIYFSKDDGLNWESRNNGLLATRIWKMVFNPASGALFAGDYYSGIYRSLDMGVSWEPLGNGMVEPQSSFIRALAVSPSSGTIFSGSGGGGVHRSQTNGDSWEQVYPEPGVYNFIGALAVRQDGVVFIGENDADGGIFMSQTEGDSWDDITNGMENQIITCLAFNDLGHIYAGTRNNGLFISINDGQSWSPVGTDLSSYEIFDIAINSKNHVFVTVSGQGVFKTTDNSTWTQLGSDVLGTTNRPIVINSKDQIFVGLQNVWVSKDEGNTWSNYDSGLNSYEINDLILDNEERMYAGTYDGVFSTLEPTTALSITFTVKMLYEDGFIPDTSQVVVRGTFNNWGVDGDWVLAPQNDAELTYSGTFYVINTGDIIVDGILEYKYAYNSNIEELFEGNRATAWDGKSDLSLEPVWFSDQQEFTKMVTPAVVLESTDSRGMAWGDYDNDGDDDLIIVEAGTTSRNDLYNNNGNKTFTKVSTGSLPTDQGDSRAAVWGDFNNDGFLDLYITNVNSENNFLYKYDNSNQEFIKITGGVETSQGGNSVGAAWGDFNNDGYLDLFVANANGETNFLYINNQDETFSAVTSGLVVTESSDSKGCSVVDFNNDNLVDIFVANGAAASNFLYQNNGDLSFTRITSGEIGTDANTSLGGSWADYNNDGLLDLYVTNQKDEPNILYRNEGSGVFTKVSKVILPPDSSESRGSVWFDYDRDGLLDLFVANLLQYRNTLYHQLSDGTFEKKTIGPLVTDPLNFSVGAGWSDYDNDGDADLFVANSGFTNALYRNNIIEGNWLKVRLNGKTSNAAAIGAKVFLFYQNTEGSQIVQRRDIESQSGLLSQNSLVPLFGLGGSTTIDSVVVSWPSGLRNVALSPAANTTIYITESGTTELQPPPAPVLDSPADSSTEVLLPPSLVWKSIDDVAKYEINISETAGFTSFTVQDSNVTASITSYTANSLTYNTTYYWRVRAKNEVGWGPWSSVWNFTTAPLTGQPDPPTLTVPIDGMVGAPIPTPLLWTSSVSGTYAIQVDDNDLFPDPVFDTSGVEQRSIVVPNLEPNTQYYWRVSINVGETESNWSNVYSFTTFNMTFQAQTTIPFPSNERRDEFSSTDYLILGLPGNANVHMSQVLGASVGERWMAYWDNGASSNYYVAVNNTSIFKFVTGRAFWIIHNGDITVDQSIPQAPLNEWAQAEISVHYGFNLITSPFVHAIDWDVIKAANGITSDVPIWAYSRSNRSYEAATQLKPVEGFYYFNPSSTRTILVVPYYNTSVSVVTGNKKPVANNDSWRVTIGLETPESFDNTTVLGIAADALPGIDDHDYRKPRGFADVPDIYFNRGEWDDTFSLFASDIRPEIEEEEIWGFQVYVPRETETRLTFAGLSDVPDEYDVYLIDKTRYTYTDLRQRDEYTFLSRPSFSDFEVVIGDIDRIMDRVNSIIPTEFKLGQNFPNPFNPATNIPVILPEKSDITLKIYNLLGQEIITVFQGTLNAGKHFIEWDGRNSSKHQMPSGIYIYQMVTKKGVRFTQKMVLIK